MKKIVSAIVLVLIAAGVRGQLATPGAKANTISTADFHAQRLIDFVQPLSGTAPATTAAALKHSEGTEKNANTI